MISGRYTLTCATCKWSRKDVPEADMQRACAAHVKTWPGHQTHYLEDLPKRPMVGDKVRLGDELYKAAKDAYESVKETVRVIQEFDPRAYNEVVYRIDGPPWMARPNQVELAWRNDSERRKGLAAWQAKQERAA